MKKNNKILILGLGLSLAFAPINSLVSSNINIAYAEEAVEGNDENELSPEEFIKETNGFLKSEEFNALPKKDQDEFKDLIKALAPESLDQKKADEILDAIDKIEVSYIGNKYQVLKKNVLSMKDNSLSKELQEDLSQYKDSYKTYEEYSSQIENLNDDKKNIEDEKNNIKELKEILKKGLDDNKTSGVDLKAEEDIYNKEDASYDEVNNAINSLNKKVGDYNAKVKEENRLKNLSKLKDIIDQEESVKKSYLYKKSGKELKEKFDASLENAKSAYKKLENKEEVNNIDYLVNSYNTAYKNLNGDKFMAEHQKLIDYFEKNKGKLSASNQKKYADLINGLPDKADSNLDSIKKLKAEIEKEIANTARVRKIQVPKKGGTTKRSRSFVRTGVKSVGIVLVVLILAGAGYFLLSKKSKK